MSAYELSEERKYYIRFVLYDKNKLFKNALCIRLKDTDPFLRAVEEFEKTIGSCTACEDLGLSLAENEYYSIKPGSLYDRLLENISFHARDSEFGRIEELSHHLSMLGNSAALVIEYPENEKKYFFGINKANLRGRAAFSFEGEKLVWLSSECFFINLDVSLFASNKEIIFRDLSAASKILPIAKMKKEEDRQACEKLLISHGAVFSPFEIGRTSARKISLGRQIFDLVEEMGEDNYLNAVRKASPNLSPAAYEKLFDQSGKIIIDFRDENILNFLAENIFHGELSNDSYVATIKKKNL